MEPIGKMSIGSMISKICRNSSATKVAPSILSNVDEMKSFYPGLFVGFVNWIWAKSTGTQKHYLMFGFGFTSRCRLNHSFRNDADQYILTKKVWERYTKNKNK